MRSKELGQQCEETNKTEGDGEMFRLIFGTLLFIAWSIFCYVMMVGAYVAALIYLIKVMEGTL